MKAVSYSEARNNLKTYLDYVNDNHDIVTITRQNGENVVLISEDDYNSINETLYLLSSEPTRKRLMEAMNNKDKSKNITFNSKAEIRKFFKNYKEL